MSVHKIDNVEDLLAAMDTMRTLRGSIIDALNVLEERAHGHLSDFKGARQEITDPYGERDAGVPCAQEQVGPHR